MTKQEALTLAVELIKNSEKEEFNKLKIAMDIADKLLEYAGEEEVRYVPYYPVYPTYPNYPAYPQEPYYYNPTVTSTTFPSNDGVFTSDTNVKGF